MGMENYNNNDTKFQKEIELLKGLPKVNTPDDFHFKLMTKIENQQFDTKYEEQKSNKINLAYVFGPAGGIVAAAVILFFVIFDTSVDSIHPLLEPPRIRTEMTSASVNENKEDVLAKKATNTSPKEKIIHESDEFEVVMNENDAVTMKRKNPPFQARGGVNLDSFIGEAPSAAKPNGFQYVGGARNDFRFEGFYIRENTIRKNRNSQPVVNDSTNNKETMSAEK